MKIAFVRIMPYPFTTGGGTSHLRDLSRALIEAGHEVHIISARPERDNRALLEDEGAIIHNVGMRHKKFSGSLIKLPLEVARRILFELSFMYGSYRLVKNISPDIVHCQTVTTESFPFALMGKPFIITAHGAHTKGLKEIYSKRKNPVSGLGIWIYRQLEKFNIKRASEISCINPEIRNYYDHLLGKKKCRVIENGIFLEKQKTIGNKTKILFSLSRLSPQKGIDYFIEALRNLESNGIKFEAWIAGDGDGDYVRWLKRRAEGIRGLKFLGEVSGKKKEEVLNRGGIFVMPSRFEPFGIALLEAMAHGCAVVASDSDGPRGIVKPNFGKLVPFGEERKRIENLTKTLEEALKWDVKGMGKNAEKEVEKYDYRKIVGKYIKMYEEAMEHGK